MDYLNLITLYSFIIGILSFALGCLFFVWKMKKENTELREQIKIKKMNSIDAKPPVQPRNVTNDMQLIRLARDLKSVTKIRIIGINSLGPIHQVREDIKELLEANKSVEILLLNPYSEEFEKRVRDVECKYKRKKEDYESHRQRLLAEYNATIAILLSIVKNISNKKLLQVKLRTEKPTFAFTATISENPEDSIALINIYPDVGRGTRGKQFRVHKAELSEERTYQDYINKFEEGWRDAKTLILDM